MGQNDMGTFDLAAYLTAYNVQVSQVKDRGEEKQYCLEECVFDSNHRGNEASIFQSPNPPFLTYQCFHDSCRGNTWKMARAKISQDESLARFMSNYDPAWKAPVRANPNWMQEQRAKNRQISGATAPGKDGSVLVVDENLLDLIQLGDPEDSLMEPEIEFPGPRQMEYYHFCKPGKGDKITFVPQYMAKYLAGHLWPIRHTNDIFWKYEDGVWAELPVSVLRNICTRAMKNDSQPRRKNDAITELADMVTLQEKHWESPGELINCVNGMVDARRLELLDHDPKYGSRSQVPCRFIPEETEYDPPELWNKTLKEIFPEPEGVGADKINLLFQFFGYVLLPDCRYEASLWMIGGGQNGKGTITDTMQAVIGIENCSNLQVRDLKDPRFNLYHLENKMLNFSTETDERDPLSTEIFKKIVSGERLTTERKYGSKYEFFPFVKFVIGLNDLPVIPDKSMGFARRVKLLRFDQEFVEGENRDPNRKKNLVVEKDAIFTWAVSGLYTLLDQDHFVIGKKLQEDKGNFMENLNPITEFWKEECEFHEDYEEEAQKLLEKQQEWMKANGQRPLARTRFSHELLKNKGVKKTQHNRTRRVMYEGVRLRP